MPPRQTSYTAYEKNELKITLTPQVSAAKPGVINILARFQVTGDITANGVTFQAAVPKVKTLLLWLLPLLICDLDATTSNAPYVKF